MKNKCIRRILLLLCPLLWIGCQEEEGKVIERANRSAYFYFEVVDLLDERDLLNPEEDTFSQNEIKILYQNKEYPMALAGEKPSTQLALALYLGTEEQRGYLAFGPFDYYEDSLEDQQLIIDWGYHSEQDVVHFRAPYEWTGRRGDVHYYLAVNDQPEQEGWRYTFTKMQPIWDFVPRDVRFSVKNEAGADLLDPSTEGNLLGQPICMIFRDQRYDRLTEPDLYLNPVPDPEPVLQTESERSEDSSRAILPLPLALRWGEVAGEEGNGYYLSFGEFSPESMYRQERFTLDWGDGTVSELRMDCFVEWTGWQPTVTHNLWCDNQAVSGEQWLVELTHELPTDEPVEEPTE